MRKLVNNANVLLVRQRYNYTPVSNYEVQKKTNPIISVTLGNDK